MQKLTQVKFNRKEMADLFLKWFNSKNKEVSEKILKAFCDLVQEDVEDKKFTYEQAKKHLQELIRTNTYISYGVLCEKIREETCRRTL